MKKLSQLKISMQQLRLNNIDKLFYNTEGVKKADKGRYKEAAEYFTKAIELSPEDSLSYFNRATVKINLGDILGAKLDFALSESFQLIINNVNKFGMN
jgi:tetratricopeptide (TPR) repeat protein